MVAQFCKYTIKPLNCTLKKGNANILILKNLRGKKKKKIPIYNLFSSPLPKIFSNYLSLLNEFWKQIIFYFLTINKKRQEH